MVHPTEAVKEKGTNYDSRFSSRNALMDSRCRFISPAPGCASVQYGVAVQRNVLPPWLSCRDHHERYDSLGGCTRELWTCPILSEQRHTTDSRRSDFGRQFGVSTRA